MRGLGLGEGFQRQRESAREASESSGDLPPAPGAARRSLPGLLLLGQGSREGRRTHLPGLGGQGLWGRASLGAPAGSAGPLPGRALRFAPSIRQLPGILWCPESFRAGEWGGRAPDGHSAWAP